MQYVFMHQRIAVCDIELDDATGSIRKIGAIHAPEHLPVGVPIRNGMADRKALNDWWTDRCIPESRSGVREAMETLNITSTRALLVKCYGLSLSDQYWICPKDANLSWDEVNFFTNPFSDDIGDVLFGADRKGDALNLSSPDNTSDGNLKKRWRMIDGKRCLVKGGSNPFRQQPFNEVIATGVMERLGIPHVPYTVAWNKGAPYSICEDFADESRELVPAWRIIQMQKKPNNISVYQHFVNCCEAIGVRDAVPFLDRMIVLDYLIANEDRHLNNIAVLRRGEEFDYCPLFDFGAALLSNTRDYPLDIEPRAHLRLLRALPLETTFGRQVQAARAVYGPQLEWDFTVGDIAAALVKPLEFYAERDRADIADRVNVFKPRQ